MLLKPSEITPRFTAPLFESVRAVPELAAVFDFVTGDAETGKAVIDNVDVLCFTGSVPTGRKIAVHCAERLIPSYLELGGKDPVIVTASADLERAATAVLRGAVHAKRHGVLLGGTHLCGRKHPRCLRRQADREGQGRAAQLR